MGCCCCHLLQHTVNFTATLDMQQTHEILKCFLGQIVLCTAAECNSTFLCIPVISKNYTLKYLIKRTFNRSSNKTLKTVRFIREI